MFTGQFAQEQVVSPEPCLLSLRHRAFEALRFLPGRRDSTQSRKAAKAQEKTRTSFHSLSIRHSARR